MKFISDKAGNLIPFYNNIYELKIYLIKKNVIKKSDRSM